jgi:hypothetical protein
VERETNTEAVYYQFPFLEKISPRRKTILAKVSRFDEEFLRSTATVLTEAGGRPVGWTFPFYLLDKDGLIVGRVGQFLKYFTREETVRQTLARIGDQARDVRYAVSIRNGHTTVYRLPSGFTNAADWLRARAREEQ